MNYNQRFDIRRVVKYLLVIMCVSFGIAAVIFIIAGGVFWKGNSSFFDVITNHTMGYKYKINSTSACKLNGIEQINISASDESVRVINTTANEVKAHFYGKVSTSSKYLKPTVKCYKSGNTIFVKIEDKNHGVFYNFCSNTKLEVSIPTYYKSDLKIMDEDGDVDVGGYKLKNLDLSLSCGSLNINNISARKLFYKNDDGNFSGNNINTKETKLQASEGSIDVKKFTGDLVAENSDGETNVEYEKFNNNIDISASEGTITLKLPKTSKFNLDAHNSEGSISCDFPVTLSGGIKNDDQLVGKVGNNNKKVRLNNLDGNISITR